MNLTTEHINRLIENLFYLVAVLFNNNFLHISKYISCIECLIRTDFNFAFALFGYYLWISSRKKETARYVISNFLTSLLLKVDAVHSSCNSS